MKYIKIILFVLPFIFTSCVEEVIEGVTDPDLVGDWELAEVLADPGNGSGTFQPISSDAEIEFFPDGSFVANYDFCGFANQSGMKTEGTYSLANKTISPDSCQNIRPGLNTPYTVNNNELIISFFCIEPCQQKFRRAR